MTLNDISNLRIINQKIVDTEFRTAKELVGWMGAVQAQDYAMAKLAVGLRLLHATDNTIESAFNRGEIIRTHIMRPTWHFVAAEDIYWLLELTAPKIKSSVKSRHLNLEITPDVLNRSNDIIGKALLEREFLTREELAIEFDKADINVSNNRLSHLMFCAELEGLICSGPVRGKKQTYALLETRIPRTKMLTRDESLAELAKRYFTSHCPATLQDFVWWSGLSINDARQALESVKSSFISEIIGTETYWLTNSFSTSKRGNSSVHLLPAFDEFLISYRDRSASLSLIHNRKAVSDNGIFRPVIVIDGQVSGLWKRTTKKDKVIIETDLFQAQDRQIQDGIEKTVLNFESFFGKTTSMSYQDK